MWLIAHKVRGEPAFDIAVQMDCPECAGGCDECGGYGYWWILNTSGYRAHPLAWWDLEGLTYNGLPLAQPTDWTHAEDCFTHKTEKRVDLASLIKTRTSPIPGLTRRF